MAYVVWNITVWQGLSAPIPSNTIKTKCTQCSTNTQIFFSLQWLLGTNSWLATQNCRKILRNYMNFPFRSFLSQRHSNRQDVSAFWAENLKITVYFCVQSLHNCSLGCAHYFVTNMFTILSDGIFLLAWTQANLHQLFSSNRYLLFKINIVYRPKHFGTFTVRKELRCWCPNTARVLLRPFGDAQKTI